MSKILIDINVVLDVLTERKPFVDDSAKVWERIETGTDTGLLAATGVTTIYYLVERFSSTKAARSAIQLVAGVFTIVPCDAALITEALASGLKDFEDACQYASAVRANADAIITRNVRDFPKQGVPVVTPTAWLSRETRSA